MTGGTSDKLEDISNEFTYGKMERNVCERVNKIVLVLLIYRYSSLSHLLIDNFIYAKKKCMCKKQRLYYEI